MSRWDPRPATDKRYVAAKITDVQAGVPFDPTSDTVEMAFTLNDALPVSGDWKSAVWQTNSTTTPPTYEAMCLVGPSGTVTLTAGDYSVWVRVTDNPEVPVLKVEGGLLTIL